MYASRIKTAPCGELELVADFSFESPDRRLVAFVESPLANALGCEKPGTGQRLKMRCRRRLGDVDLLGDVDDTDAVLHQVATPLRREVALGIFQEFENL